MSNEAGRLSPAPTADAQVEKIFAWRRGFNAMHLIDLGLHSGLFAAFAASPGATCAEIAAQLGLHAPYVDTWCTTAYSFELLDADEGDDGVRRFRLAPFIDQVLGSPAHPRYLGGYVQLGTRHASEDFRFARQAMASGETVPFQGRSDDFAELVGQAIAGVNLMVARKILPALPGVAETLGTGGSVLEVGCGTGRLALQLARAFPAARCTGIDIDPTGLAAARDAVARAGLAERVTIVHGDVADAVPRAAFDVVVMVEVLHEIAAGTRPEVIRSCAGALRPGGWLVIVDETYPSTLAQSRHPDYLFPVQTGLEEMTWGNVVPTREEQERLLRDAGFAGAIERSLFGEGFTVLATRR